MYLLVRIALVSVLGLMAAPAGADSRLDGLTRPTEQFGWEAVGRLEIGSGGFCTGVLVAPDLVLTAAHCLHAGPNHALIDPRKMSFRAGFSGGSAVADAAGRRAIVHPDYDPEDSDQLRQLRNDIAFLQLRQPVPTAIAAPFSVGSPASVGDTVSVVSYARGRADVQSRQRACAVTAQGPGVLEMSCDATFGASGAPVFDTRRGRPRIVSLISRGYRSDDRHAAYGMQIAEPIAELKAAFRAGRGVYPREETAARRVLPGQNLAGTGDSGAKFVRP